MMRRYIGRATGQHRRRKAIPRLLIIGAAIATVGTALMVVLILNLGENRPENEKGSVTQSPVMPDTTDPSTPGHKRHRH
jgi:hypothetical protein